MSEKNLANPSFSDRRFSLDPAVLARVARLDLRARYLVDGLYAGLHKGRSRGFSVEFSEFRRHVPGEPSSTVDWRVYARTGKLFIREYCAETALRVHLAVDMSASMGASPSVQLPAGLVMSREGHRLEQARASGAILSKREYAVALASSLAWLLVRQGDSVGLFTFTDRVYREIPPRSRRDHAFRVMAELSRHPAAGKTNLDAVLIEIIERLTRRGMVVLISDFMFPLDNLKRRLAEFRHRRRDILVFCILDHLELHPELLSGREILDPESGERNVLDNTALASRALRAHLKELSQACRSAQAPLAITTNRMPFDRMLLRFLESRKRR